MGASLRSHILATGLFKTVEIGQYLFFGLLEQDVVWRLAVESIITYFLEDWDYFAKSASSGLKNRLSGIHNISLLNSCPFVRCAGTAVAITGWFRSTPLDPLGQLLKDSLDGV